MDNKRFEKELVERLKGVDSVERASCIIRLFFSIDDPSPELTKRYHEWFIQEKGFEHRLDAATQVFYEVLGENELKG